MWLFVIMHFTRATRPVTAPATPPESEPLTPTRHRSHEPKPFEGFTHKPHCALCERDTVYPHVPPPLPPGSMPSTHRRPRVVDTSQHFCPCALPGRLAAIATRVGRPVGPESPFI